MNTEMTKDDLIHHIGALIVRDEEYMDSQWFGISVVGRFKESASQVQGYMYEESGKSTPATPNNWEFHTALEDLREKMQKEEGGDPWKTCLIQILREDMSINVKFDYERDDKFADEELITLPDRLKPF